MRQSVPHANSGPTLAGPAGCVIFPFCLLLSTSYDLGKGVVFLPCELNAVGNTEIIRAAIEQAVFVFVFHPDFANIGKFKNVFSNSEVINRGVAITQIQDEGIFTIASIKFVDANTAV